MMRKAVFALPVLFLLFLSGCQKAELAGIVSPEAAGKTGESLTAVGKGVVTDARWYGTYYAAIDDHGSPIGTEGDPDLPPGLPENEFIRGGVATLPWLSGAASFYSLLSFNIPSQYNLPGDSILYEVVVKNQNNNSGIPGYDVILSLIGERDTARVHLVGDKNYQYATSYSLGDVRYTNLPALVQDFSTFRTVKLATKKGQTAVYVNNKLLANFKYKATDKLGRLVRIEAGGNGCVVTDNVKLTNSLTSKKLMLENFNTEGQSHTVFY